MITRKQGGDGVAFAGGIVLCHSRRDDETHFGYRQALAMASAYGKTPPWHDVQLALHGGGGAPPYDTSTIFGLPHP